MHSLKYPVTILLILLTALQTFSKWAVIVEFEVNRDYIAKNLCVNRLRPSCCCRGKCYLTKKINADESQQQAPGKSGQREESPLQLFEEMNKVPERAPASIVSVDPTRYLDPHTRDFYLSVFQPPQA